MAAATGERRPECGALWTLGCGPRHRGEGGGVGVPGVCAEGQGYRVGGCPDGVVVSDRIRAVHGEGCEEIGKKC